MSTDSHDRTKTSCKTPGRCDEENTFDGKRIKKERGDICAENGDAAVAATSIACSATPVTTATTTTTNTNTNTNTNTANTVDKGQLPAGRSFTTNGFHGDGDPLQDLVATKFATLVNHSASSKQDKIRIMIEDGISEESRARVDEIFSQVERLKLEEKLLLYLKLPLLLTNQGGTIDPLRQPLNPLGNRYEIHQTIMWIKTHLEEDPDVSLPKQEVYDEYNIYCIRNSMKPLSTADFGKVMKQVYPRVRPRRLGTRGNSRYCYAGMRKRIKLDPPTLPKISGPQTGEHSEENITEEMLGAASTLIREWAETILGLKFSNLSALARHLVDNFRVDTRSLAAVCILSTSDEHNALSDKQAISDLPTIPVSVKPAKLREAQLQLQRKLQQREHIKDQKRRHLDVTVQNKEKVIEGKGNFNRGYKKAKSNQSPQGTNTATTTVIGQNSLAKLNVSAVAYNRQKRVSKTCNQQQQQSCNVSEESNCDNLVVSREDKQSNSNPRIMMSVQRDIKSKNSRKRANNPIVTQQESSPEKQTKLAEESSKHSNVLLPKLASIQRAGKISVILASNSKSVKCKAVEAADSQLAKNCDIDSSRCSAIGTVETTSGLLTKDQIRLLQDTPVFKNEKVRDIDTDALDDYLNGGNNSQEQEEELLQYFQQSSSSSSDVETSVIGSDAEQISRSDKVSQLRLILQQNLKASTIATDLAPATIVRQTVATEKRDSSQKNNNLILSTLLNHNPSNTRRRVSFETNVVEHVQEIATQSVANTVPQSPNTRRRIFNFTPISPGPHSPINGRASKSNSANASPFVSPRNTPVPRSRSNLQAVSSRTRGQKTLSRSISCNVPYTIKTTDTFIVPTSSGAEPTRHVLTIATTNSSEVGQKVVLKGSPCTAFFDLTPQKQLLINYPSQENLQEIKNVYQKGQPPPPDQEITELLHASRHLSNEQLFYRSQSVPLHRMVNPMQSPISTQHSLSIVQSQSFNPSTSSSVAPTPVPSEYNDFVPSIGQESTYLLDDANFMSDDQQFLMTDKGITSENINNIFTILDEEGQPNLQMLPEQTTEETLNNAINLALPNTNLNLSEEDMLDPSSILNDAGSALQKIIQSRSYPNTPLPAPVSAYTPSYIEDSNGSRSYPSTPLHTVQEVYQDPGEPILSSPILNSLSLQSDTINVSTVTGATAGTDVDTAATTSSNNLCRNVADFLEASFLGETDTETDDLDPLGNFDGLQDMDSLTPLFNEVTEPNH